VYTAEGKRIIDYMKPHYLEWPLSAAGAYLYYNKYTQFVNIVGTLTRRLTIKVIKLVSLLPMATSHRYFYNMYKVNMFEVGFSFNVNDNNIFPCLHTIRLSNNL